MTHSSRLLLLRISSCVIAGGATLLATMSDAHACGAAYPGGPMMCTMADAPGHKPEKKEEPPIARLSASYEFSDTTILFGGGKRTDLTRHTVFVGTELPLGNGFGLRFGAGGIVAGELTPHLTLQSNGKYTQADFGPGASAFVGVAKTIVNERESIPFVQLGATISGSRAATRGPGPNDAPSFTAFDLRLSATVGKTIAKVIVPYATVRAFGGPVYYRYGGTEETGTDLYHYQVAGGFAFSLPSHVLDFFVEGVPLGEKGVSGGLGTTF